MLTIPLIVVILPLFLVIFVCAMCAFEQTEFRDIKAPLSLGTSVLCVLGLLRNGGGEGSALAAILIPYEALAYFVISVIVLWLLSLLAYWVGRVRANWIRQAEEEERRERQYLRAREERRRIANNAVEHQKHETDSHEPCR